MSIVKMLASRLQSMRKRNREVSSHCGSCQCRDGYCLRASLAARLLKRSRSPAPLTSGDVVAVGANDNGIDQLDGAGVSRGANDCTSAFQGSQNPNGI